MNKSKIKTCANGEAAEAVEPVARICQWRPLKDPLSTTVVVRLGDGREGLLNFGLDRAFDESADWCRVDVIADGTGASQTRYGARRIEMPDGLRKHILRVSVAWAMTDIADHLAEYRSDVPEFCAYVSAEGMRCGSAAAEEIDDLAETLKGCDLDYEKKEKKEVFANLERLAGECRRLWGESCDHERI